MERKEGKIKAGCVKILWTVMVVFLCVVPCVALYIESGETLNVGTGYEYEQILNDSLVVKSNGTLNMCPGAYVDYGINAETGSTVNIWGGTFRAGYSVIVSYLSTVTVYGPAFEDSFGPITTTEWKPATTNKTDTLIVTDENGDPVFSLQFYSNFAINLDSTGTPPPDPPTPPVTYVDIDIKPGSYPNAINLGSNGVIPVAILSTEDFTATTIDPDTVFLGGSGVAVRGKGNKSLATQEDVNGDGLMDLVVKVETENLDPGIGQDGFAILQVIVEGTPIYEGLDEIIIVPPTPE